MATFADKKKKALGRFCLLRALRSLSLLSVMMTLSFDVVADQGFLPAGHCRLECRYNDARRAVVSAELLVSCVRADGTTVGEQSVPIDPRVALALLGFPSTEKLMEIADAAAELEVAS